MTDSGDIAGYDTPYFIKGNKKSKIVKKRLIQKDEEDINEASSNKKSKQELQIQKIKRQMKLDKKVNFKTYRDVSVFIRKQVARIMYELFVKRNIWAK